MKSAEEWYATEVRHLELFNGDERTPEAFIRAIQEDAQASLLARLREPTPGMIARGWETIRRRQPMGRAFASPGAALKEAFGAMVGAAMEAEKGG